MTAGRPLARRRWLDVGIDAMPAQLGKLSPVDPRTVWKHEEHDFTPWLSENIDMLGAVLGLDLEVVARESAVGDFSVDIVARDVGRNRLVVIENQLGPTDQPQNWYSFNTSTRGFQYGVSFAAKKQLRAEVYIDFGTGHEDTNERVLEMWKKDSADIEAAFGEKLSWESLDTKRACRVACYSPGSIEDSEDSLEGYLKWMVERLLKFKKVFGSRLAEAAAAVMPAEPAG
jgi:hypothetical protein